MVLKERKLFDIKVGSIAEFQGKEYRALFISTVRASKHWYCIVYSVLMCINLTRLAHDSKYGLGLLKDDRALNTALSRVTSMLVIVGDPYILRMVNIVCYCVIVLIAVQDKHWSQILEMCRSNGNYIGPLIGSKYLLQRENEVHFIISLSLQINYKPQSFILVRIFRRP